MRPMSPMSPMGPMSLMSLMSLLWLVVLLAACSGEQVAEQMAPAPEPTPAQTAMPIAFAASQGERAVTRADIPLEQYTNSFRVWGFKNMTESSGTYGERQTVMDEYTVQWTANTAYTSATNTDGWEYLLTAFPEQSIKFWDFSAKAYRFFGVAEMSAVPGTWDFDTDPDDAYKYTCSVDGSNEGDAPFIAHLWFSTNDADDYPDRRYGHPVTLEFIKPLSKVRFLFVHADPTVSPLPTLVEPDFRPEAPGQHIATAGTVSVSFPTRGAETQESWSSVPDFSSKYLVSFTTPYTENVYFTAEEITAAESVPDAPAHGKTTSDIKTLGSYQWYSVLPVESQGTYLLTVTVNGEDRSCTVPATFMAWKPGYSYTYIFKVNDEGGVELDNVSIGIKDWGIGVETPHFIYNW